MLLTTCGSCCKSQGKRGKMDGRVQREAASMRTATAGKGGRKSQRGSQGSLGYNRLGNGSSASFCGGASPLYFTLACDVRNVHLLIVLSLETTSSAYTALFFVDTGSKISEYTARLDLLSSSLLCPGPPIPALEIRHTIWQRGEYSISASGAQSKTRACTLAVTDLLILKRHERSPGDTTFYNTKCSISILFDDRKTIRSWSQRWLSNISNRQLPCCASARSASRLCCDNSRDLGRPVLCVCVQIPV